MMMIVKCPIIDFTYFSLSLRPDNGVLFMFRLNFGAAYQR